MTEPPIAGTPDDVLSLCRALRDAAGMLGLEPSEQAALLTHVALAERAAMSEPIDKQDMAKHVRAIRYHLIEVADGPVSAFIADDAARVVGDGIGKLFS